MMPACYITNCLDEELTNENKMVEQFKVANHITGEVIVCGWHVNTHQVWFGSHDFWLPWHHY